MTSATITAPTAAPPTAVGERDRFIDAVRAGALLVVVLGHWLATLPRVVDGTTVANDHLLHAWGPAGLLTWVLQVVPVFVLVSAAVSSTSSSMQRDALAWWAERVQRLARPTVTYLVVLAGLWLVAQLRDPVGVFASMFDGSLTVHLWFIAMLLLVQAALPAAVVADRRFGLRAVAGLVAAVVVVDLARVGFAFGPEVGHRIATAAPGVGWANVALVWLVPQQLGLAWKAGRLRGRAAGVTLLAAGGAWLWGAARLGYPLAMVGQDPVSGASNVLPPSAALLGVVWLQAGLVLLLEDPVRRLLRRPRLWSVVQALAVLGMPLYLWHKLAELPALWVANRLGITVDAGLPGTAGFWSARATWIGLCALLVVPMVAAVVAFERRRRDRVPLADARWRLAMGGALVLASTGYALQQGLTVAPFAAAMMLAGSLLLRPGRRWGGV